MDKRLVGSSIALVIGCIQILVGLANPSSILSMGTTIILSALAYRSVKKRKLGLVPSTRARVVLEILAILIMVVLVIAQHNFVTLVYEDPFPNLFVPLWGLIAFMVAVSKRNYVGSEDDSVESKQAYVYVCNYCEKEYQTKQACINHEKTHKRKTRT